MKRGEVMGLGLDKDMLLTAVFSALLFIFACCIIGKLLDTLSNLLVKAMGGWLVTFTFVGIIHHELSHALFAFLTGAKVDSIVLFRLKEKNGNLGEVKFTTRGASLLQALQIVLASAAPVLTGCVSLFLLFTLVHPTLTVWWHQLLAVYLELSIFLHMSLSKQDVRNIFSQFGYLFLILFVLFYLLHINMIESISGLLFN